MTLRARLSTKHFNLDIGRGDLCDLYEILLSLAENWDKFEIERIRAFTAGFTSFYLSITAKRWYHVSDCNDPDYEGDAMDCITDHPGYAYRYKSLSGKPCPEDRWLGQWRQFDDAESLCGYIQPRLQRIRSR